MRARRDAAGSSRGAFRPRSQPFVTPTWLSWTRRAKDAQPPCCERCSDASSRRARFTCPATPKRWPQTWALRPGTGTAFGSSSRWTCFPILHTLRQWRSWQPVTVRKLLKIIVKTELTNDGDLLKLSYPSLFCHIEFDLPL